MSASASGSTVATVGLVGAAGAFLVRPERVASPLPDGVVVLRKETAYHRLLVVDRGPRRLLYFNNFLQGVVDRKTGISRPVRSTPTASPRRSSGGASPRATSSSSASGPGCSRASSRRRRPRSRRPPSRSTPRSCASPGRYFGFRPDANDRVLVGDGRSVLEREKGPWDADLPRRLLLRQRPLPPDDPRVLRALPRPALSRRRLRGEPRRRDDGTRPAPLLGHGPVGAGGLPHRRRPLARARGRRPHVLRRNAILVATTSTDRLSKDRVIAEGDRLAAALHHPPIADWARAFDDGEMKTADVPILTDSYSPTDALQHLGR